MRKVLAPLTLLFFLLPFSLLARPKTHPPSKLLVFTHLTVIDATGAPAKPNMTVIITGDRIAAIGETGKVRVPKDTMVVDAAGKFLIPGLWDMHGHLTDAKNFALPMLIANGVTGVRDMGGDLNYLVELHKEIKLGKLLGPRIIISGPFVDGPKPDSLYRLTVTTPGAARYAVTHLKQRGVDFIKVHNLIPRDAYLALADEAKKQDISFAGHVPNGISAAEASDAGQKSIEHLTPVDEMLGGESKALFERFAKNGTWQVPTLISWRPYAFPTDGALANDSRLKYIPSSTIREWDKSYPVPKDLSPEVLANRKRVWPILVGVVGRMQQAGVQIMAGTDFTIRYVYPGFSLHDELALYVQGGLTPMEALQTATRNPAKYLGMLDTLGTVETGKIADLVLLDANPLADITNTQKIFAVVVGGKLLQKDALQKMLADVEAAANRK